MSDQDTGSSQVRIDESESMPKRMKTNKKWDVNLRSSRFADVLKTDTFVDKTLMIREFLTAECDCLVTTPRRFGKSVNADMLRLFLTIEVDDNGHRITKANANEPIRDTDNYRLFANCIPKLPERNLNISKERAIMDTYLGKYPVIYVNFKSASVLSLDDAVSESRRVIHESFLEHKYLCKSGKLEDDEKADCERWCSKTAYESLKKSIVLAGLKSLSEYLTNHFECKCFVIVDEYDSICSAAMFKVEEIVLDNIVEFFMSCLDFVSKDNNDYVEHSFFTGISHMCTTGLSKLGNVLSFRFLQNDRFVDFYGLMSEELEDLKNRLSISEEKYDEALKYYTGYTYNGRKIVCTWSFMCFIVEKKIGPFWRGSGICTGLVDKTFTSSVIKFWVMKLLSSHDSTQEIDLFGNLQVTQIVQLKEMSQRPDIELSDPSLLFNFLQEQGFLNFSIIGKDLRKASVEIPNEEVREEFKERLLSYYKSTIKGLNFRLVKDCAVLWDNIDFNNEEAMKETLKQICDVLNDIFKSVSLETKNESCFHHVLFVILLHTKYKCSSEIVCVPNLNKCRVDILLVYENYVIILELKFDKAASEALNQIIDPYHNYCDIFEKNHNYVKDVKSYILLGTSMSIDKEISMMALFNNKNIDNKIVIHP